MNEKARSISVKPGQSRQLFILVIFCPYFIIRPLIFFFKWPLVLWRIFYFDIWFENSRVHVHFTEKSAFRHHSFSALADRLGIFFSQSLSSYLWEEREPVWKFWVRRFGDGVTSSHPPSLPHWSFLQKLRQWLCATPASLTTKAV